MPRAIKGLYFYSKFADGSVDETDSLILTETEDTSSSAGSPITYEGTYIRLDTTRASIYDETTTLPQALEVADANASNRFASSDNYVIISEFQSTTTYPCIAMSFMGWFSDETGTRPVFYFAEYDENGNFTGGNPYLGLYIDSVSNSLLCYMSYFSHSNGYSGLSLGVNQSNSFKSFGVLDLENLNYQIIDVTPESIETVKPVYTLDVANPDSTVFPQYWTKYSDGVYSNPRNLFGKEVTGTAIDEQIIVRKDSFTFGLGPNAKVGLYKLEFMVDNVSVTLTIEIIDSTQPEFNPNPYNPGGVSRPGGGGGSFDGGPTDDPTIFIPNGTTEDNASLSRIYTRYVLDSADLAIVGSRLWATDVINDIINTISKLFSSPFESIISLLSFPFDISSMLGYSAAKQVMTWGNTQFILDGLFDVPQTAAVYFDWGEISIESFYDGFLDYAPYTKMELYLPWGTGVVSIDPNECTPGKIRIQSNIELDKGTAVHIVTSEFTRDGRAVKEILGTYGTVVGKQIPITALDNAGKAHAVASVAVTAGAIALAGGAGAASTTSASALTAGASTTALSTSVSPAQLAPVATTDMYPLIYTPKSEEFKITPEDIKLATDGINAAMTPGHVARNGSFMTGSAGLLPTTPFLIISRPEQSVPENYGHYYGYPSNIYSKLSDLSGFTQVGSIHLENIVCTEKEREELMTLLQGGVLL